MTESQCFMASGSCVATMTHIWLSCARSPSSSKSPSDVVESSAPVGSSARRMCCPLASARATPTRCRWPPETSPGWHLPYDSIPSFRMASWAISVASDFDVPCAHRGSAIFSVLVNSAMRLSSWKMTAMWRNRNRALFASL